MSLEAQIKQKALKVGFDAVGITTAEPVETSHVEYFQQWLADGNVGEMGYMHRNAGKRFDPAKLLKGAKSVICVALNYRLVAPSSSRSEKLLIARFAQYEDYHPFIKDRLFQLAEYIKDVGLNNSPPAKGEYPEGGRGFKFKACVDSVPIAERALAQRAGLGFIGRNHMLIHPKLGNQILLGELITTLELEPDEPLEDLSCGDCGKCIRACPTGALGLDGSFDAAKCISYQTIEAPTTARRRKPPDCDCESGHVHRNPENCGSEAGVTCGQNGGDKSSPPAKGEYHAVGRGLNYIFGCDECILACPHELGKPPRQNMDFQHHPEWQELTPDQILNMTEEQFQKTFANSGFIRLGLDRLKHNCKSSHFSV